MIPSSLVQAEQMKQKANQCFKLHDFKQAINYYELALEMIN